MDHRVADTGREMVDYEAEEQKPWNQKTYKLCIEPFLILSTIPCQGTASSSIEIDGQRVTQGSSPIDLVSQWDRGEWGFTHSAICRGGQSSAELLKSKESSTAVISTDSDPKGSISSRWLDRATSRENHTIHWFLPGTKGTSTSKAMQIDDIEAEGISWQFNKYSNFRIKYLVSPRTNSRLSLCHKLALR